MIAKYYQWLHGKWPAGTVEKLPSVGEQGTTNVAGVRIVGDLSGVPLLKFSSETGVQAVRGIMAEPDFPKARAQRDPELYDIAIIGAGVSGISAAMEAQKAGLKYILFETSQAFNTVENFPKGKYIFTYPTDMKPSGGIQYGERSDKKESLLEDMKEQMAECQVEITPAQISHVEKHGAEMHVIHAGRKGEAPKVTKALRSIIAIGRSGNYREMKIPGEQLDKVMNRLHDPKDYCNKKVAIVGGGDSAAEAAIALAECGSHVTFSYRKPDLTRPKPENTQKLQDLATAGKLTLALNTNPVEVTETAFKYKEGKDGEIQEVENDAVFAMIGREAPLDFFRRSGISITGERNKKWWITAAISFLIFAFIYQVKKGGTWLKINEYWSSKENFPFNLTNIWTSWGELFSNPKYPLGTLKYVVGDPGFWYSLAYCCAMVFFGIRRIQRRKTPYVKRQTMFLWFFQLIFLFLIPYLFLPWAGFNGAFDSGVGKAIADELFPVVSYGSGREYWRAFGLILAWPLFIWNMFTSDPMWGWLVISLIQTFVIIPFIVRRWGKGAYCGWVCSCGGLAETMGDAHRHKMPHGPVWNKLNMIGQVFLALAFLMLGFKVLSWLHIPGFKEAFNTVLYGTPGGGTSQPWGYNWFVDLLFAGILGVAFYFHLSGRVWCRFACPLAALMHIYSRFGKFRIFAEKKKCISCNVCTSVCHQGIDIMNFANKGLPMEDPECVRCSACVQQCPTGVLQFGRIGKEGNPILDGLKASPVQMKEE